MPTYIWTPYFWILLVTAVTACVVFLLAWPRRETEASKLLALMMLAIAWWNFAGALEAAAVPLAHKIFWSQLVYIGMNCTIVFLLLFALTYTQRTIWLQFRRQVGLWVAPVISMGMAFTNGWHGLLWTGFPPSPVAENLVIYEHGPLFTWVIGVIYGYVGVSTILLVGAVWMRPLLSRRQSLALVIATMFPWVASLLYITDLNPVPGLDITAVSFMLTALVGLFALTRIGLFDLIPIARDQIVESMVSGVLVLDVRRRVIDLNPMAERMLHVRADDVIGRPVGALLPDGSDDFGEDAAPIEWVLGDGQFVVAATAVSLYDRRWRKPRGFLIMLHDITRQKRAEQALQATNASLQFRVAEATTALQEEKDKLEAVLANVSDSIAMVDSCGKIVYVNESFSTLTGYVGKEVLGVSARSLAGSMKASLPEIVQQVKRHGSWQGQMALRQRNGRLYEAHIWVTGVTLNSENAPNYIIAMQDITQQQAMMQARRQFLHNVSHQLRTPITSIKLYTDLFNRGSQSRWPRYVDALSVQADRLEQLVNGVMELVTLDSELALSKWTQLSLPNLLVDALAGFSFAATANGVRLGLLPIPPDLPLAWGNEQRLLQVLAELLRNAMLFTPTGGEVMVGVKTAVANNDNWVLITVSDTGPGIAEEDMPHIFERFYRGTLAAAGNVPGLGLGLSLVETVMALHGGRVEVESSSAGTTFTLWLHTATAADMLPPTVVIPTAG